MSKYLVYALKDPRTQEIRYIGKSTSGMRRVLQHKNSSSLKKISHKNNWIKSLLDSGLMYQIEILQNCSSNEETLQAEMYWIKFHKEAGANLTNLTDGGEGTLGRLASEETKQLISLAKKEFHKNHPEVQQAITEKQRKPHQILDGVEHKHCSDCNSYKPLKMYSKQNSYWDGLKSICKQCATIRIEEYRKENFKKLNEQEWKQSYVNRSEANSKGVTEYFKNNPEAKANISKKMSKPVIGTCVTTGKEIRFESALKAKEAGFNNTNLGQAISKNKVYKGYIWKKA